MDSAHGKEERLAAIARLVTGLVNQELLLRNEYLVAENRIQKARIQERLRLSQSELRTRLRWARAPSLPPPDSSRDTPFNENGQNTVRSQPLRRVAFRSCGSRRSRTARGGRMSVSRPRSAASSPAPTRRSSANAPHRAGASRRKVAMSAPAGRAHPHRSARGERRDQERARSSMAHRPSGMACRVAAHGHGAAGL
jgi:hypothetical protein